MLNKTAQLLSLLLDPVVVAIVSIIILLNSKYPGQLSLALPLAIVFFLYYGYLWLAHPDEHGDLDIPMRKERDNAYILAAFASTFLAICYGSYLFASDLMLQICMLLTVLFGVMYFINRYVDKASFHAAALTFWVLLLSHQLSPAFSYGLLVLPLLYWARINTHKHTWFQLLLGSIVGITLGLLSWTIK